MQIATNEQVRFQLHGKAKNLPESFLRHFRDFMVSPTMYMVITQWKAGVSGTAHLDSVCGNDWSAADELYRHQANNREVDNVYFFEWDLGINLVKDATTERQNTFLAGFEKTLR